MPLIFGHQRVDFVVPSFECRSIGNVCIRVNLEHISFRFDFNALELIKGGLFSRPNSVNRSYSRQRGKGSQCCIARVRVID